MKKLLLALASVLAIVAGCAKENLSGKIKSHSGIKEISASLPDQTKAYLEQDQGVYKFHWYDSETISVGSGTQFITFTLSEGAETPKGKFESSEDLPEADNWFAVSPEMADATSSGEILYITYPAELEYHAESGCAEGGEIMVSRSYDGNFAMHNAVGYIKFQVAVLENESINKIEVSGKGGRLAGSANITFDDTQLDTVKFASSSEGGLSTLTVNFPDGAVAITPEGEPFSIMIPVAPLAKGVMVTVTMASGKVATFSSSTPVQIGQIVEFPVVTFDPDPVAKVGTEEFYSINQAILYANELGEDATVELLDNCNVGKDCEVMSNKIITLDLAGHTLFSVGDKFFTVASGTKGCIIMDSSIEQTGTITNTNPGNSAMKVFGPTIIKSGTITSQESYGINMVGGSLIVEGGLIKAGSRGIYCYRDADNVVDSVVVKEGANIISSGSRSIEFKAIGGNLIIYGGRFQSQSASVYVYDGTLKIYDGFFVSKSNVIYANRSSSYNNQVDIYGGFFYKDTVSSASVVYGHATTDSTRVWGGYYNLTPTVSYIPAGYEVGACDTTVNDKKFTATIIKSAEVVCTLQLGSGAPVQKATVNEAFDAAKAQSEPATVTLIADCSTTDSIGLWAGHNFTLDLNGHTLTTPGTKVFRLNETGAVLTIKSSVEGGMMYESSTGSNSLIVKGGGKCILESGILKGNNATSGHVYVQTTSNGTGEFIMNGGMIWTPNYNAVSCPSGKFIMNGGVIKTDLADTYPIRLTGGVGEFHGGSFESMDSNYGIYASGEAVVTIDGTFEGLALSGSGAYTISGGTLTGTTRVNGGNVTVTGGSFTNNAGCAFYVTPGGNVTLNGGTFDGNSGFGSIRSCGSLIINDGVTATVQGENNVLYVGSDDNAGSMTVNGGVFTGYKTIYGSNGSLSIAGGIFNSDQRAVYTKKTCGTEIVGGYFNTPADSIIFTGSGAKGIAKGGWFTQPLADSLVNSAFILDNTKSTTVQGVTYNYQVIENTAAPDVVSVNGTNYKSVDAAIEAAETAIATGNVTFKVLGDCSTLTSLDIAGTNSFTIDLNGHNLTTQVNSTVSTLNVTDNSAEANGSFIANTNAHGFNITAGTMNFDKGKIVDIDTCAVCVKGESAVFNMTGGVIVSENPGSATATDGVGAVGVVSGGTFNLSGGMIDSPESSRGVWVKSSKFNMTGGTVIAKTYPFYVYGSAVATINDGVMIQMNESSGGICHNGTSNDNLKVNISGGYFYATSGKSFTCYTPSKYTNKFNITGGYFNMDVKAKASSNFAYPSGYELKTVDPKATKEVKGVTYEFGYQVAAK